MNLLLYGVVFLSILGALGGIGYKIRQAGADSVRAELQPKLTACEGKIQELADETAKKQSESLKALRKAESRGKVWEADSARWRAVLASRKPTDPQDCKAAWTELRK